jgi:hypothetical protein
LQAIAIAQQNWQAIPDNPFQNRGNLGVFHPMMIPLRVKRETLLRKRRGWATFLRWTLLAGAAAAQSSNVCPNLV